MTRRTLLGIVGALALGCAGAPEPQGGVVYRLNLAETLPPELRASALEETREALLRRMERAHLKGDVLLGDVVIVEIQGGTPESVGDLLVSRSFGIYRVDEAASVGEQIALDGPPVLANQHLADAEVQSGDSVEPTVTLTFTPEGKAAFARLTKELVGRRLALVVDGRVVSAPIVREPITGGRASITPGAGDLKTQQREAEDLARALAVPMPFPIVVESVHVIPPL